MKKAERKNMVQFQIQYHMDELKKSKGDYWATRNFERFVGTVDAYYYIGEVTEVQRNSFFEEALDVLSKKSMEELCIA